MTTISSTRVKPDWDLVFMNSLSKRSNDYWQTLLAIATTGGVSTLVPALNVAAV